MRQDAEFYRMRREYLEAEWELGQRRRMERRIRAALGTGRLSRLVRWYLDRHTVLDSRG